MKPLTSYAIGQEEPPVLYERDSFPIDLLSYVPFFIFGVFQISLATFLIALVITALAKLDLK